MLQACAARVEHALLGEVAPYERAQWLLTLSDAWRSAGDVGAERSARERGLTVAREHGLTELLHEYGSREDLPAHGQPVAVRSVGAPLGGDARRVVGALATFGASGEATVTGADYSAIRPGDE
jgi:hypothetical protein